MQILNERAGQAKLDKDEDQKPGPAVCRFGGADFRRRPLEHLFEEAIHVFNGETGNEDTPDLFEVRWLFSPVLATWSIRSKSSKSWDQFPKQFQVCHRGNGKIFERMLQVE